MRTQILNCVRNGALGDKMDNGTTDAYTHMWMFDLKTTVGYYF